MIKIEDLNWLSEDAKEAEIILFDETFRIHAFSHPFNQKIGDCIEMPLYTLNAREICRINKDANFFVQRIGSTLEYKLLGRIKSIELNQITIGEFIFELDTALPGDIEIGDYVSFKCDRIDFY